jgi:hypothetical protein
MDEDVFDYTDYFSQRASALGALALVVESVSDDDSKFLLKTYMKKLVDSVHIDLPPTQHSNEDNVVTFGRPKNTTE